MKKGKDVLKPHSGDRKKGPVLKVKQIDDKVREHPSMASSSNSELPEDETLCSKLNGGEQKQTVLGQGGIGGTKIINTNSNITFTYGKVQIKNYCGDTRRINLDVCKDTRGDILPTSKLAGETTAIRNMEKIYDFINGNVRKIGVYGMGGIGKTTVMKHINNRILEEKKDKFDCVIWVTVSKESSIFNLQHDIACKIDVNLSNYEDTTTRAGALFKALKEKGRYLLILDDLWEGYPLEDVGIPDPDDPTSSNICKLVLTTRSLNVCRSMKCEAIKLDLLSKDEAWSLFLDHVGHDVLNVKGLEPIIRGVASECARLPLAISTIGRSMRSEKEACEWRDALAKLMAFSKEHGDKGRKVIEQLKFSFDRLENKKFQKCLSYCALYPEDYEIEREELVELLALEGIIEEKESKRDEIDECNAILNRLINQCLLEGGKNSCGASCVKMHDLVRDMTLQIDDLHSQYLTISDTEIKEQSHVKWSRDLLKIHISNCYWLDASPMCPRLTTFILHNSFLLNIPNLFFQHFDALKILKLSFCRFLEVLPDAISNLGNLVGLFLRQCNNLRYVPTLAMLKNLQSLEISFTSLRDIPKDFKKLSNLRYLYLAAFTINVFPPMIRPRFSNRRSLVWKFDTRNLLFRQNYSCKGRRKLVTTSSSSSFALQSLERLQLFDLDNLEASIGREKAPCNVFLCLQVLEIFHCQRIKGLINVGLLSNLKNLNKLKVGSCYELEEIIGESLDNDKDLNAAMTCVTLPKLRCLELYNLPYLKSICHPTRELICESLKEIDIKDCPELEQCVYAASEDSGEPSPSPSLQPIELKLLNINIRTGRGWFDFIMSS